jgi:benzodiazapine receptor
MTQPSMQQSFFGIQLLYIALIVIAIAGLGGMATSTKSEWYLALTKPPWQPPPSWFGPAWTTIYLLLIVSANLAYINTSCDERTSVMTLYAVNGLVNLAWSFIFFRWHSELFAGIDILAVWTTVLLMMIRVWPSSPLAGALLIPYLAWVSFASVLNWWIVVFNRA